ncbi:MAG: energy transducer TonB [Pyrinomonadaceae bacterium]|nr:energy transducer TonB [Pyrinomonadaceae bacterium]
MKLRAAAASLFICLLAQTTSYAQDVSYWVKLSPPDEQFSVMVPPPIPEGKAQKNSYEQLQVDALRYSVTENGVVYTVWSMNNRNYTSAQPDEVEDYLDECAELAWESLLLPRREKLGKTRGGQVVYERELKAGEFSGRQYLLRFGEKPGVLRVFAGGPKIYVLTVFNANAAEAGAQRFLNSFVPDRYKPQSTQTDAETDGNRRLRLIGPGVGGNLERGKESSDVPSGPVDYDRIFMPREVTERARITARPEPQYTETARRFQVSGTVILEAVLSKTGEITDIRVVKGLPHGLTRSSLDALKRIKFVPATKDGVQVSQRIMVEYNYNIY